MSGIRDICRKHRLNVSILRDLADSSVCAKEEESTSSAGPASSVTKKPATFIPARAKVKAEDKGPVPPAYPPPRTVEKKEKVEHQDRQPLHQPATLNPKHPLKNRMRSERVDRLLNETEWDHVKEWVEFEPILGLNDGDLDELFVDADAKDNKRNFITYVAGDESLRKEMKVRVNCKYWATDTQVKYPAWMSEFVKTTLGRKYGEAEWETLEDRVGVYDFIRYPEESDRYEKMCIFLQEPRTSRDNISYMASRVFDPEIDQSRIGTISKKQRNFDQRRN